MGRDRGGVTASTRILALPRFKKREWQGVTQVRHQAVFRPKKAEASAPQSAKPKRTLSRMRRSANFLRTAFRSHTPPLWEDRVAALSRFTLQFKRLT